MEINVFVRLDISKSMDTVELVTLTRLIMGKIVFVILVTMETEINVILATLLVGNAMVLVQINVLHVLT